MSSLASPDEAPFVFGAYATHLTEVAPPDAAVEADVDEIPVAGEPAADVMTALLRLRSASALR